MKYYLIALSAALLANFGSIASAEIYKWTDEKGQLHYTERPAPNGQHAENIGDDIRWAATLPVKRPTSKAMADSRQASHNAAQDSTDEQKKQADQDTFDTPEEYKKKLENYCSQQKSNLAALKSDSPIAWEEKGETVLLSTDDRKKKIKNINSSIEKNCKSLDADAAE